MKPIKRKEKPSINASGGAAALKKPGLKE